MDIDGLPHRLDRLIEQWRADPNLGSDPEISETLMDALIDVFVRCPLGYLDRVIDQGLTLARLTRDAMPKLDEVDRAHRTLTRGILGDARLRDDPGKRLEALGQAAIAALGFGDLNHYIEVLQAIGAAEVDLERFMEASVTYRRAALVAERLGKVSILPELRLGTAQAFRYLAGRGQLLWDSVLEEFDGCLAALDDAELDPRDHRRIRAAALIDRAPCYIEIPRSRGASVTEVKEGIRHARESTEQGAALAHQDPDLAGYVRLSELNLVRIDSISRDLA